MVSHDGRQSSPLCIRLRLPSAMARDALKPVMMDSSCALLGAVPDPPFPAIAPFVSVLLLCYLCVKCGMCGHI